jgi:hypothetical protein
MCVHSAVDGCASFFFSSISDFLDAISDALATRCSGATGRGAGRTEREDFFGGWRRRLVPIGNFGGSWQNAD